MTAKATPEPKGSVEPVRPKDLSHIRVGPSFEGKTGGRCIACREPTKGKTVHIVENTRTDSRKAICAACLANDPDLSARQQEKALDTFLA